jgi:hypothetical protein|eukprot:COSAG01_NODE_6555_length_3610_cov_36.201937_3_plen_66_part_00
MVGRLVLDATNKHREETQEDLSQIWVMNTLINMVVVDAPPNARLISRRVHGYHSSLWYSPSLLTS